VRPIQGMTMRLNQWYAEAVTLARQASLMIIGERLRAEYGVIDVPLPEQMTELLGQLERSEKSIEFH
jgi:hypothetical protein